jgi:hypothetical protein
VKPEEVFSSHSKLKRNTCQTAAPRQTSPPNYAASTSTTCLTPFDSSTSVDSAPDVNNWSLVADWDESASSLAPVLKNFEVSQLSSICVISELASRRLIFTPHVLSLFPLAYALSHFIEDRTTSLSGQRGLRKIVRHGPCRGCWGQDSRAGQGVRLLIGHSGRESEPGWGPRSQHGDREDEGEGCEHLHEGFRSFGRCPAVEGCLSRHRKLWHNPVGEAF